MAVVQSSLRAYDERYARRDQAMLDIERRPSSPASSPPADTGNPVAVAHALLAARKRYSRFFPKVIFRDSAWDMVLELFLAEREDRPVCVKQLMAATNESCTAAIRRIDQLEEISILARSPDPRDHRRVLVSLTERGRLAITELLCDLGASRAC